MLRHVILLTYVKIEYVQNISLVIGPNWWRRKKKKFWLEVGGRARKNGLHPLSLTGFLVGSCAVTVDGGSGISGLSVFVCLMNVVVEVAMCGVALSVGIRLETEGRKVVVVEGKCLGFGVATGVAVERTVSPAMLRAQTKSCMISLWVEKKTLFVRCCWLW